MNAIRPTHFYTFKTKDSDLTLVDNINFGENLPYVGWSPSHLRVISPIIDVRSVSRPKSCELGRRFQRPGTYKCYVAP